MAGRTKISRGKRKSSIKVDYLAGLTSAASPDLVILVAASYRVVIDRLMRAMQRRGLRDMRPAYGFVIRAVAAESPSINRLAELLDTSKQAASKLADAMVRADFLERFGDPEDRRVQRLRLARKGRRVLATALATSRKLEEELRAASGGTHPAGLRGGLLSLLSRHGALEEVLARRARPVW